MIDNLTGSHSTENFSSYWINELLLLFYIERCRRDNGHAYHIILPIFFFFLEKVKSFRIMNSSNKI